MVLWLDDFLLINNSQSFSVLSMEGLNPKRIKVCFCLQTKRLSRKTECEFTNNYIRKLINVH